MVWNFAQSYNREWFFARLFFVWAKARFYSGNLRPPAKAGGN
jgi:hypothetical protein